MHILILRFRAIYRILRSRPRFDFSVEDHNYVLRFRAFYRILICRHLLIFQSVAPDREGDPVDPPCSGPLPGRLPRLQLQGNNDTCQTPKAKPFR